MFRNFEFSHSKGQKRKSALTIREVRFTPKPDVVGHISHVRKVPILLQKSATTTPTFRSAIRSTTWESPTSPRCSVPVPRPIVSACLRGHPSSAPRPFRSLGWAVT